MIAGANWSEGTPYGRALAKGLRGDLIVASHTSRYEIRAFRADGTLAVRSPARAWSRS